MSATHSRSGLATVNWRSTRSGAGRAVASRTVVRNFRRLTPYRPAVRIRRATRLRPRWMRQFEPSARAIRNWVRQADRDDGRRQDGLTTVEQEELRRLRRENRALR